MNKNTYNITAQIYPKNDKYRQTILMNSLIESTNTQSARDLFKLNMIEDNMVLIKILSIEKLDKL